MSRRIALEAGKRSDPMQITPPCQWAVGPSASFPKGGVFVSFQTKSATTGYNAAKFLDDSLSNVDVQDQLIQLTKKASPRV